MASKKIKVLQNVVVKSAPQGKPTDDIFEFNLTHQQLLKYLLNSGVTNKQSAMEDFNEEVATPGPSTQQQLSDDIMQLLECSPMNAELARCAVDLETPSQFIRGYKKQENEWMETGNEDVLITATLEVEELVEIEEEIGSCRKVIEENQRRIKELVKRRDQIKKSIR